VSPLLRKLRVPLHLAGCFLAVALSTCFIGVFHSGLNDQGPNSIWIANGVLLAYLLLAPRRRWPMFLVMGAAGFLLGGLVADGSLHAESLLFMALNLLEVGLGAWLLRRRSAQLPKFTDWGYLLRFAACALLAGPLASGSLYVLYAVFFHHSTVTAALIEWTAVDSLGTAVATPACVAIFRTRTKNTRYSWKSLVYPALIVAFTLVTFSSVGSHLNVFVYPLLIMVLVTLGLGWAVMATLFFASAEGWWMIHSAAVTASSHGTLLDSVGVRLQVFVASAMFVLYTVSAVLESRRSAERHLKKIAALHGLVTEYSRDAIIVADFHGSRSLVSAAVGQLTGWSMEEFAQIKTLDLLHPADREKAEEVVRQLAGGAEDATLQCRVRKKDDSYIWVESKLRAILDPQTGRPEGMMNIVRDISERKVAERQLEEAYSAVEALAVTDPLTGLANRRRFEQALTSEWRRGLRERKPLALLMIDADMFKAYNDTYGHPRGDNCLKQIAEAILDVVARPGDLVARYGGEEFAVILPNTEIEGAREVAREICESMRAKKLQHSGNPYGIMTVSVGCAAAVPSFGQHGAGLVELADQAMYAAKRNGRNRACYAGLSDSVEGDVDHSRAALKSA
jgi:diguanylate cyclase (GGDEF)-like protein/PAS domain S-box-containing protein